jgi:hypothetical protein
MNSSQIKQKVNLKLDWCSHKAAKYACENWHYSKSIPAGKLAKVGAWENDKFIGVVIFGWGANRNMAQEYQLRQTECSELVRVALTGHHSPVSKIVAISIRLIKKQSPGVQLLVSYADPLQDHHGGIYQAMNWVYKGSTGREAKYRYKGKLLHARQVSETGVISAFGNVTRCPRICDCEKIMVPGKHKYLYPLNKEIADRIKPLGKPYPKPASDKGPG